MLPADHAALSIVSILNSDLLYFAALRSVLILIIRMLQMVPSLQMVHLTIESHFCWYVDGPPTKYDRLWSPQMDWPCHKWSPAFFTYTAINGSKCKLCMEANYMCRGNACSLHTWSLKTLMLGLGENLWQLQLVRWGRFWADHQWHNRPIQFDSLLPIFHSHAITAP